jgi:repressor of nif and glnA expression
VHVSQALQHVGVGIRRRVLEQIAEIGIRLDAVTADERGRTRKHRLIGRVATDKGEQRKLVQCLWK